MKTKDQGFHQTKYPKLFEPFTRGEDAKETSGAGLGLAIAIEQAHLLEVELRVESVEPHGARFVMEIPVADEQENGDLPMSAREAGVHEHE